ncbi:uncharacterized protein [Lolium perenne]|uniref:uncharacterized protein n=1 Tax=Lolium perenne TaxID=4522 RepID=UPI0021F65365|nr:uncharacterized protein LOC127292747 [Lolium perenne]
MSDGADKQGMKKAAQKLVQSLQQIVNLPLPEIKAALSACGMDTGAAVARLLSKGKHDIANEEEQNSKSKKEKIEEDNLSANDEDDEDSSSSTHDLDLPTTSSDELDPYIDTDLEENDDGCIFWASGASGPSKLRVGVMESKDEDDEDQMIYHPSKKPKLATPSGLNTGKKKTPKKKTQKSKSLFCKVCKTREFANYHLLRRHNRLEHGNRTI